MKTIVYMGCDFPSGNAAAIRVAANVFALNNFGYNVIVLSYDHVMPETGIDKYSENITVVHVQYPMGPSSYIKYLFSIKEYVKVLKSLKTEDIDAVITYDQPAISFLRLKKYCSKKKIALICDCAEWHTTVHLRGIAKWIKAIDISLSMRWAYKSADGIIAISNYLEEFYKNKVEVIRIPPLQYHEREHKELSVSHPRKFIYAGVAGRDKDRLDLIIDAFEKVDGEFAFHVFGMEENEFVQQYEGIDIKISKIRERAKIVFYGYVSHDVILHELHNADFSLLIRNTSRKNNAGFPTKFVECVNYGVPVIANEFSDVRYYVEQYELGLLCENIDKLSATLQDAINISDEKLILLKENCINYRGFFYDSYTRELGEFISLICKN